jgi:hypothetical protein
MKKILLLTLIPLLLGGLTSVILLSAKPNDKPKEPQKVVVVYHAYSKQQIVDMESLGLTKSEDYLLTSNYDAVMHKDLIDHYKKDFGAEYISENGLDIFLAQNKLMLADIDHYIGSLPINEMAAAATLKEKIRLEWAKWWDDKQKEEQKTTLSINGQPVSGIINGSVFFYDRTGEAAGVEYLYIVAPKELIRQDQGDQIVGNRMNHDPMILMKVKEGGYIILAKW